jgi:methyl-accepting chemotaxis protein
MLWWLVDNANVVLLVLGMALLTSGVRWWQTRRRAYAVGAGVFAIALAVVWLLATFILTDRMLLLQTLRSMADSINKGDLDKAFAMTTDEIEIGQPAGPVKISRKKMHEAARAALKQYNVSAIEISGLDIDELERPKAVVRFIVRPEGESRFARCRADFILVKEGEWRLRALELTYGIGGNQQILPLPLPR